MDKHGLTVERVRELLDYNPETGVFVWKPRQESAFKTKRAYSVFEAAFSGKEAGSADRGGYILIRVDGVLYKAHRLAWLYVTGSWPKFEIDHIDGSTSNNAWGNLRDVEATVNCQNKRRPQSNSSTKLLGAFKCIRYGRVKFLSRISVDGKNKHLGTFDDPVLAHEAYVAAKRRLHAGCTI